MGVRDLVNPASTAAAEWWCHSAMRNLLIGNGLRRTPRPPGPTRGNPDAGFIPLSPTASASDRKASSESPRPSP